MYLIEKAVLCKKIQTEIFVVHRQEQTVHIGSQRGYSYDK